MLCSSTGRSSLCAPWFALFCWWFWARLLVAARTTDGAKTKREPVAALLPEVAAVSREARAEARVLRRPRGAAMQAPAAAVQTARARLAPTRMAVPALKMAAMVATVATRLGA